jgi:2,3-bisphosphoglycerate-dependent phosphoglycerate mutase/probable phosphoglycerate mutase
MELYIIRHAQSANNLSMLYDGMNREVDPSITELGKQQTVALAEYLANAHNIDIWIEQLPDQRQITYGCGITKLYTSPMRRALETCQPIAEKLRLIPEVWVELHEHGGMYKDEGEKGGIVGYSGMTRAEMQQAFPHFSLPPTVTDAGWYDPADGAEDIAGCQARAIRVATALRAQASSDERVALITHGTFSSCLLKALLNLLPAHDMHFNHYNAGVSRVDFRKDGTTVLRFTNRMQHLKPDLTS